MHGRRLMFAWASPANAARLLHSKSRRPDLHLLLAYAATMYYTFSAVLRVSSAVAAFIRVTKDMSPTGHLLCHMYFPGAADP